MNKLFTFTAAVFSRFTFYQDEHFINHPTELCVYPAIRNEVLMLP